MDSEFLLQMGFAAAAAAMVVLMALDIARKVNLAHPGFVYALIVLMPAMLAVAMTAGLTVIAETSLLVAGLTSTADSERPAANVPMLIIDLVVLLVFLAFAMFVFVKSNISPLSLSNSEIHVSRDDLRASPRLARYGFVASLIYQVPVCIAFIMYCGWLIGGVVQSGFFDTFANGILIPAFIVLISPLMPVFGILLQASIAYVSTAVCIGWFAAWVWSLNAGIRAARADVEDRTMLVLCAVGTCIPLVNTVVLVVICRALARRLKMA